MRANSPLDSHSLRSLEGVRVIGLLNGTEVFGQERANVEVFKSLQRQGASVLVGVNQMHQGGALKRYVEDAGFESVSLPYGCHWSKQFFRREPYLVPQNFWRVFHCSVKLARLVKNWQATHLHVGNPLAYSYVAPYLAVNGRVQLVYRMGDEPPRASGVNLWVWKRCYYRANVRVVNSEFVKISVASTAGSEQGIHRIYNVAPSISEPDASEFDSVASASSKDRGMRILYVGQISEHKGVHHFVECALSLAALYPACHFDVVGGSQYTFAFEELLRNKIKSLGLADRVRMCGKSEDPGVYFRAARVLVVPSLFEEPAANVVLEAKRFGVPAIVYPSGGLPELLTDGVTGWVCRSKSASELKECVERAITLDHNWDGIAAACVSEYNRRFGVVRFDREWNSVYSRRKTVLGV